MQKLFENWREFRKETMNEIYPAHERRPLDKEDRYIDPGKNQLIAELEDKFLEVRYEFIETMVLDKREDLTDLFTKKAGNAKLAILASTFFAKELKRYLESTNIKFSKSPNLVGTVLGQYLPSSNTIIIFKTEHSSKDSPELEDTMIHELGHAYSAGITYVIKKSQKISTRHSKLDSKRIFEEVPEEILNQIAAAQDQPIESAWDLVSRMGNMFGPLYASVIYSAGKAIADDLISHGMRLKGYTVPHESGPMGKAPGKGPARIERTSQIYDRLKKITRPGLIKTATIGDSLSSHEKVAAEFEAFFYQIEALLGRAILPIDIDILRATKQGIHRDPLSSPEISNFMVEWYDSLPNNSRLRKRIDKAIASLAHASTAPVRRSRRSNLVLAVRKVLWGFKRIGAFKMIDFDKNSNYIVSVLRDIFKN